MFVQYFFSQITLAANILNMYCLGLHTYYSQLSCLNIFLIHYITNLFRLLNTFTYLMLTFSCYFKLTINLLFYFTQLIYYL